MKVTIEIFHVEELERLLPLLKSLQIEAVRIHTEKEVPNPAITKGDKAISPEPLFGLWKDNPRDLTEIRSKAWKRGFNRA